MSEHVDKAERSTKRLPKGNYALVSVDVDTTGRRLIDEVSFAWCPAFGPVTIATNVVVGRLSNWPRTRRTTNSASTLCRS